MHVRRALALVGAVAAAAFAGCEVPFAPKWDADMYLPLTTQPIALDSFVPAPPLNVIPAGKPLSVSFKPQPQDVTGEIGAVLKKVVTDTTPGRCSAPANPALSCDVLTLTISKTTLVAAQDTLFIAPNQASLNTTNYVVFPISLAASDLSKTDSIHISRASVTMLQNAGQNGTPLWIQLRGTVSNPGPGNITITSADVINIKVTATVRIAVSSR